MENNRSSSNDQAENETYSEFAPKFKITFLGVRYWKIWILIGLCYLLALLPYKVLRKVGKKLGKFFLRSNLDICRNRRHIAKVNIDIAFRSKPQEFRDKLYHDFCINVGHGLVNVLIAWYYSRRRFIRLIKLPDKDNPLFKCYHTENFIILCPHFLNMESVGRILGEIQPTFGSFLPNSNPLWDWLQYNRRAKNNKALVPITKFRLMISILRKQEGFFYAPDQDIDRSKSVFVPFFEEEHACTTRGTYMIYKLVPNLKMVPLMLVPSEDPKYLYELKILDPVSFEENETPETVASKTNKAIEELVLLNPAEYMWFHRRFHHRLDPNEYVYEVTQEELHK